MSEVVYRLSLVGGRQQPCAPSASGCFISVKRASASKTLLGPGVESSAVCQLTVEGKSMWRCVREDTIIPASHTVQHSETVFLSLAAGYAVLAAATEGSADQEDTCLIAIRTLSSDVPSIFPIHSFPLERIIQLTLHVIHRTHHDFSF
jgi:hypothetical protein